MVEVIDEELYCTFVSLLIFLGTFDPLNYLSAIEQFHSCTAS